MIIATFQHILTSHLHLFFSKPVIHLMKQTGWYALLIYITQLAWGNSKGALQMWLQSNMYVYTPHPCTQAFSLHILRKNVGQFFEPEKMSQRLSDVNCSVAIECLSVVCDCRRAPCSCWKTPSLLQIFNWHSGRALCWKLEVTGRRPAYEAM